MKQASDFTRVFDMLAYQEQKYPQRAALNCFVDGIWKSFSIQEIQQTANRISHWFLENGFKKGDTIAIMPTTGNPLWMMLDFGCQQIGMVTVPIHPTSSTTEIKFILDEVQAKILITVDEALLQKAKDVFLHSHLYHLQEKDQRYFPPLFQNNGIDANPPLNREAINPSDIVCILYTSGTTGTPKGAVLSHHNIVSNIKSILPLYPIKAGDRVISFLPFSHIFERSVCYAYLAFGASVYFCSSPESIAGHLKTVKPVFFTSVPKTLERMYSFLRQQCEQKNFLKRWLVQWAMGVGESYQEEGKGIAFKGKLFLAKLLALNRWRNELSSKTKYIVVGAAALRPEIGRLFSAAGVKTLSGYGMTEASPFIAVNRPLPGMNKFGTVGLPLPGVDIKLDEPNENNEGEILVRGPNIMSGYFNRPELNKEIFTDGWFRTGDVGKWTDKRFLTITGRKKDLFKTTAGIYIAPQELEAILSTSPFISQCVVHGFNRAFVIALIVPNFSFLKNWCEKNAIHWTSPQFMVHNIKVVQRFQQEIDRLNESFANFKKVKKFILSDTEWTTETGELTASLKLIRPRIVSKFEPEIEKLYS